MSDETLSRWIRCSAETNGEGRKIAWVAAAHDLDATDVFRAVISMKDGEAVIDWEPDLNEGGTKNERVYTVEGCESLTEGSWEPTNSASCFFRVKVNMP